MTLGQRIAQKRKELGLSQEGLGERLGVSRQAIYKWESDNSLPEIDKLITLSKIFSVSVGWLLGVEESPAPPEAAPTDRELNEIQLAMVQEIVERYQQSQPKPKKSVWDRWSVRILFAMCGTMLALLVGANSKMKEMDQRYAGLANSIGEVNWSVDRQINSITTRVEDILKSQNNLAAEWSAEVASTDLGANTVTFDVRAVPRTYVEGMTAVFQARYGDDTVELAVEPGEDHTFSGQITCPLTNQIDLTAVFITGDKRETQWLDDFYDLYNSSFPDLWINNWLWGAERDGVLPAGHYPDLTVEDMGNGDPFQPEPPTTLRVGLFRDRKLLFWYERQPYEFIRNGKPTQEMVWTRPQDVTLEPGHEYCEAAVYTDEYGRQRIYTGSGGVTYEDGRSVPSGSYSDSLTDWEF